VKFKDLIKETYAKKHEEILSKLGAIISYGLVEAGGRNTVITLQSKSGNLRLGACMGMLVFT
jgi:26S proteasome regulatory subunit N2